MFNDAIVYDRYGPPAAVLSLKRTPLAPLAGGRVRVRMRYAPVNPSDLIPITGAYRHRTRLPAVPGYEGLGEVVAAPFGSRLTAGQRVLPLRGGGTWQRFIDLDETWLVPVPAAVDDLLAQEEIRGLIIGEPSFAGLVGLSNTAFTLRVSFTTLPLKQWTVRFALDTQVKKHFDRAGVRAPVQTWQQLPMPGADSPAAE